MWICFREASKYIVENFLDFFTDIITRLYDTLQDSFNRM